MKQGKSQRGFIALMSSIIISAVLLLTIASVSVSVFFGRFNMLDAELKERSSAAADACADAAMLKMAQDPSYAGGDTLTLNKLDECRIGAITGATQRTFEIQATSSKSAVTNLKVVVNTDDLSVISWQEIANF